MERKIEPLEAITAAELEKMEFPPPDPIEYAKRLEACDSVVTKDGEWKYDKVPYDLVLDILDYLWNAGKAK